jgi:hypothetical protein
MSRSIMIVNFAKDVDIGNAHIHPTRTRRGTTNNAICCDDPEGISSHLFKLVIGAALTIEEPMQMPIVSSYLPRSAIQTDL